MTCTRPCCPRLKSARVSSLSPEAISSDRPDFLARPDFAQLVVLLRHAQQGAYVFALYNSVPVRDEVVAALRGLVAPLPVYEFTLTERERNPLAYLERLPAGAPEMTSGAGPSVAKHLRPASVVT